MSATIVLALRLITALALFGFIGWVLIFLYREVNNQGLSLASRKVPEINISVRYEHGNQTIKHFSQPEIMLGRDPACDIPIMDDSASTKHAQLSYHHGQWWLEDLASTNGTSLNETAVNMPTVITTGDEIKCGSTRLIITLSENVINQPTQRLRNK